MEFEIFEMTKINSGFIFINSGRCSRRRLVKANHRNHSFRLSHRRKRTGKILEDSHNLSKVSKAVFNSKLKSKVEEEVHKDEENSVIAKKQVVKRGVTGKVKWFNVARGYGFIERDDNEQDVFRML